MASQEENLILYLSQHRSLQLGKGNGISAISFLLRSKYNQSYVPLKLKIDCKLKNFYQSQLQL